VLAYAKLDLYDALLNSDVPEDPYLSNDLARYMPRPLRKDFAEAIRGHRLRREIVATYIANSLVNRAGPTFISEVAEESGFAAGEIARAYTVTRGAFGLREVWNAIESLDNRVSAAAQTRMLLANGKLVRRATLWFLRNLPQPLDIAGYTPGIRLLTEKLDAMLAAFDAKELARRAETLAAMTSPTTSRGESRVSIRWPPPATSSTRRKRASAR
jgi:glutamate dehydrogenase